MKSAEQLADGSIIYVTTPGTQVGIDSGRVVVRAVGDEPDVDIGETIASFPLEKVDTVNLFAGVDFTQGLVKKATDRDLVLNYFSQNGRFRGQYQPRSSTIAAIRRHQYSVKDERALAIARQIVRAKIAGGVNLLKEKGVSVPKECAAAAPDVAGAESMNELRGIEGQAARAYFGTLDDVLTEPWGFDGRDRRPPGDPANSLLSLCYSFFESETTSALRQVNLDPYLGLLHADRHGRPSLSLDLLEEFRRDYADRLTFRLANRGTLSPDHFTEENRLSDDGFDIFLDKFDGFLGEEVTMPNIGRTFDRRTAIRQQALLLRKSLTGELVEYPSYER